MQAYCYHYVNNGFKKIKAAIAAGYSPISARSSATYLMKLPKVLEFIEALKEDAAQRTTITYEQKLTKLWNIVNQAAPEYVTDPLLVDAKAAISAIAELNKM